MYRKHTPTKQGQYRPTSETAPAVFGLSVPAKGESVTGKQLAGYKDRRGNLWVKVDK